MKGMMQAMYVTPYRSPYPNPTPILDFIVDKVFFKIAHKLFPKKFPIRTHEIPVHTIETKNITMRTSDYKTFVMAEVLCDVKCPQDKFDSIKMSEIVRQAFEAIGDEVTYEQIRTNIDFVIHKILHWEKFHELLGDDVSIVSVRVIPKSEPFQGF